MRTEHQQVRRMTISDSISAPSLSRFAHTLDYTCDAESFSDHAQTEPEPPSVSAFALAWLAAGLEDTLERADAHGDTIDVRVSERHAA